MFKTKRSIVAFTALLFLSSVQAHIPQATTPEEEALVIEAMVAACIKVSPAMATELTEGSQRFEAMNSGLVQRSRASSSYRDDLKHLTEAFIEVVTHQKEICPQLNEALKKGIRI